MKTSIGIVLRRYFDRLTLPPSRKEEVAQVISHSQHSNTDNEPIPTYPMDSDYNQNEALRRVRDYQKKHPVENLVARMEASSVVKPSEESS